MTARLQRNYATGGHTRAVEIERGGGATDSLRGKVDGAPFCVDARVLRRLPCGVELLLGSGSAAERVVVVREGDRVLVARGGRVHRLDVTTARAAAAAAHDPGQEPFVTSPMTGVVLDVKVAPGDSVAAGATLFVVEAMKMEFVVEAPRDVVVEEVRLVRGGKVDIGETVVTFAAGGPGGEAGGPVADGDPPA